MVRLPNGSVEKDYFTTELLESHSPHRPQKLLQTQHMRVWRIPVQRVHLAVRPSRLERFNQFHYFWLILFLYPTRAASNNAAGAGCVSSHTIEIGRLSS